MKPRHTKMLSFRYSILSIVCTSHMFVSSSSDICSGGSVNNSIFSYITIQNKMPEHLLHGVSNKSAEYQLEDLDVLTTVGTGGWGQIIYH